MFTGFPRLVRDRRADSREAPWPPTGRARRVTAPMPCRLPALGDQGTAVISAHEALAWSAASRPAGLNSDSQFGVGRSDDAAHFSARCTGFPSHLYAAAPPRRNEAPT